MMWIEIVVNGKVNASTKSLSGREMNLSLVFIQSFSLLGKGWKKWKVEQKVAKAVNNKEKKMDHYLPPLIYILNAFLP